MDHGLLHETRTTATLGRRHKDALGTLAGFLSDETWSHYTRVALQKMEGENVTDTLLQSLETLQGNLRLGVIDTIGRRRDPRAVPRLSDLLTQSDAEVAAAAPAAAALGMIGTTDSAEALSTQDDPDRKKSLASAVLIAGQRLVKSGSTQIAGGLFDHLREADVPKPYRIGATQNAMLARGKRGVDLVVE